MISQLKNDSAIHRWTSATFIQNLNRDNICRGTQSLWGRLWIKVTLARQDQSHSYGIMSINFREKPCVEFRYTCVKGKLINLYFKKTKQKRFTPERLIRRGVSPRIYISKLLLKSWNSFSNSLNIFLPPTRLNSDFSISIKFSLYSYCIFRNADNAGI